MPTDLAGRAFRNYWRQGYRIIPEVLMAVVLLMLAGAAVSIIWVGTRLVDPDGDGVLRASLFAIASTVQAVLTLFALSKKKTLSAARVWRVSATLSAIVALAGFIWTTPT